MIAKWEIVFFIYVQSWNCPNSLALPYVCYIITNFFFYEYKSYLEKYTTYQKLWSSYMHIYEVHFTTW